MPITIALSQFYGVRKTVIGAAQKPKEKPKESFAKMIAEEEPEYKKMIDAALESLR